MSRPPRPYPASEVSAGLAVREGRLEVFAPTLSDLVETQHRLSIEELGQAPPGGEGDFAGTLFGLSAVVAHVLGVYQDFYGGEAFLGTARTEQSLIRHGRRIGYVTDPGVAASGAVAVTVKPGLSGTLPEGLALLSLPRGEQSTQSYQTLDARRVDARWNSIAPLQTSIPRKRLPPQSREIEVDGVGYELVPGEQVALVRLDSNFALTGQFPPILLTIEAVVESAARVSTTLRFTEAITNSGTLDHLRVLARPRRELRLFGWDADPRVFPPAALSGSGDFQHDTADDRKSTKPSSGTTTVTVYDPVFGYEVSSESSKVGENAHHLNDLYLEEPLTESLVGSWILKQDGVPSPYFVTHQSTVSVAFIREETQLVTVQVPTGNEDDASGAGDAKLSLETTQFVPTWISASTTRIRIRPPGNKESARQNHDVRSRWLADFALALAPRLDQPNPGRVVEGAELLLAGDLTGLEPGMLAVVSNRAGSAAQLIELTHVLVSPGKDTTVVWKARGPAPADHVFTKADTVILGNVIRVSHGKGADEVLGDSDGVTPFLRFTLKKSLVTHLSDPRGAIAELEVRVGDVLWTRVRDFSLSGPEDRHYLVERDESQVTQVIFGDGRRGAVPPAGRRHIRARYREGLGRIGNVAVGRLSRLEKAHPLIRSVTNPVSISGGTEPAALNQVRLEATRFIRTFDRAVSASDYADLALLYPGVARARAVSDPAAGVELVVADRDGAPLGDLETFRQFLDGRRDRSLPLSLRQPVAVDLSMGVRIEYDPTFFDFRVEQAVRDQLTGGREDAPGLFTFAGQGFGEAAYLSRVYQAVNAAAGVLFSEILELDLLGNQRGLRDIIQVAPHEWLRLLPENLRIETRRRGS